MNAYFKLADGSRITGQDTLRQLGFGFGRKPTMDAHIEYISTKFRKRLWYLRHLKKAGVPADVLIILYKCFLVSILDYASVVYHPMLTGEQTAAIERLQASALRVVYSYDKSYKELLELSGLSTLHERRCDAEHYITMIFGGSWFSKREEPGRSVCTGRLSSTRYKRRLNEIHQHALNKGFENREQPSTD